MEKKGLIKSLKSVSKSNRKVYLLMEVEPSVEVTGGLSGLQSFDLDRMELVCDKIVTFARRNGSVSLQQLFVFVK